MKTLTIFLSVILAQSVFASAPKYVFLFIGDGMSTPQRTMAEEFSRKAGFGDIAMNHFPVKSATRTHSANSVITDSAASATAIACGVKTNNGMLGVDPATNHLESIAYVAQKAGKKIGIITTVTIVHATPAGFYAHRESRGMSYRIGLDLVSSGFDYFAGGGVYDQYDNKKDAEYRGNVFDLARKAGYIVNICDIPAWKALKPGSKSWNVFSKTAMNYSIDANTKEPTVAEMLSKGIELLDGPNGFFIMCEGGKIDYAGHANDAAANLRDLIALDKAVRVALKFQEEHPEDTLIVTTGDHETGGLSMGFAGVGSSFRVELLANQTMSVDVFADKIKRLIKKSCGKIAFEDVVGELEKAFGFVFPGPNANKSDPMLLTPEEVAKLKDSFAKDVAFSNADGKETGDYTAQRKFVFAQTARKILAAHAGVAWSTSSHTALPTLTTAKGRSAEAFANLTDNTEISKVFKKLYRGE